MADFVFESLGRLVGHDNENNQIQEWFPESLREKLTSSEVEGRFILIAAGFISGYTNRKKVSAGYRRMMGDNVLTIGVQLPGKKTGLVFTLTCPLQESKKETIKYMMFIKDLINTYFQWN